jgi:hypothetical protein
MQTATRDAINDPQEEKVQRSADRVTFLIALCLTILWVSRFEKLARWSYVFSLCLTQFTNEITPAARRCVRWAKGEVEWQVKDDPAN